MTTRKPSQHPRPQTLLNSAQLSALLVVAEEQLAGLLMAGLPFWADSIDSPAYFCPAELLDWLEKIDQLTNGGAVKQDLILLRDALAMETN